MAPPRNRLDESLDDPQQLRARMQAIRDELQYDFSAVQSRTKEMFDWKHHVRSKPWLCTAAAALVGFAIAPKTKRVVKLSDDQLAKLAKLGGVTVAGETDGKRAGAASTVFAAAGAFAARTALNHVLQKYAGGYSPSNTASPSHQAAASGAAHEESAY